MLVVRSVSFFSFDHKHDDQDQSNHDYDYDDHHYPLSGRLLVLLSFNNLLMCFDHIILNHHHVLIGSYEFFSLVRSVLLQLSGDLIYIIH